MNYGTSGVYGGVSALEGKGTKLGSFWGHYTKEKEKYYDTLTGYLLLGFIVPIIFSYKLIIS